MKTERLFKTPLSDKQARNSELNHIECNEGRTLLESCPRRIVFELTNKCNFQCIMCGREAVSFKTRDLPAAVVKACSPLLPFAEEVTLHGWGEGTLHPELAGILEYLNTFKLLRKYFVTNGSTLPRITQAIFAHHVDLVALSLDGAAPGTNDSIRKGGDLKRELRSIRKLLEEKERRGLDYPYVNFVFTAMKRNIMELPDMVSLAHSIGVPEVKAVYLTIFNESMAHESLLDMQGLVREVFTEARERAAKFNIKIKLPDIQGECDAGALSHKPCAFPWRDLYIGSDAYLRPCQSSAEKLLDTALFSGFEEVWNSDEMQRLRARVNDEALMSVNCRHCYHSSCANWNLKTSFFQAGREFAPEWGQSKAL
ncbi:MAG: radical SAM protein [Deltaproteobacteria bacterium]|nr:radical SAM protein [Deltaproteobacteria bacterium]